ncbi:MAG: cytochrome P450 [Dehalococcoidia bacterium]
MTTIVEPRLDSPDTFVPGVPHDVFTTLRREAPVYRHASPDGNHFWVLTKYDDIAFASQHPAIFSSAKGTLLEDIEGAAGTDLMMLNMDPPRHTKLRALVNLGFTPRMIRQMETHVRDVTRNIVDAVAAKGECDFVTEVAAELPLQVITELIGVPQEERHLVFNWSNQMVGVGDPEYATSMDTAIQAAAAMFGYADKLAAQRREVPHDDLVTALMNADVAGEKLTPMEFDAFFLMLSVAGNETTRNLISGGMLALIEHPEEMERVRNDMSLLDSTVEEMLRWVTPVMYFRRTATQDTEVRGVPIKAGEKATLWYISGNRDEEIFDEPQRFDVTRDPNPHIAFGGGGPHFCLGYSLARLEINLMFEEILTRMHDIQLTGPVPRLRSNFISGIKHMPMRFRAA